MHHPFPPPPPATIKTRHEATEDMSFISNGHEIIRRDVTWVNRPKSIKYSQQRTFTTTAVARDEHVDTKNQL